MNNLKLYLKRLHAQLDEIGMPEDERERVKAFAGLFHLSKQESNRILTGALPPSDALLQAMAEEFDVSKAWLSGEESDNDV